jgi:hypothetical protein
MHISTSHWQRSSYCGEGDACLSVTGIGERTVRLTESGDPTQSSLSTTPTTWASFLRSLKEKDTQ